MSTTNASRDGVGFGPTANGKMYLAVWYHRGTGNKRKSCWSASFPQTAEYALFENCDASNWKDGAGAYWGLISGAKVELGGKGERFGYFPANSNINVPWHGYPVSCAGTNYMVPDSILDMWTAKNIISDIMAKRIRGGKL